MCGIRIAPGSIIKYAEITDSKDSSNIIQRWIEDYSTIRPKLGGQNSEVGDLFYRTKIRMQCFR